MVEQAEIAAVHGDDTLDFLDRLGVRAQYEDGSLVCSVCGVALIDAGLGAVRGTATGEVVFACARLDCLDDFHAAA